MYAGLHVKYPLFLSYFNEIWIFSKIFKQKIRQTKFHENPSNGSRVFPCGQRDIAKLIVAFCNFAKAPKTLSVLHHLRGFVAIVGTIQANSLSLLKAEQTKVELTALLFMLNLRSTTGKPLLRNSFLLVYELQHKPHVPCHIIASFH